MFAGDRSPHCTADAGGCFVHTYWAGTNIDLQVLCYQYGGDSQSGLKPAGASDNWRCLAVENLSDLELLDGPWQTAENHSRPQNCIEEVEIDVDDFP